MSSNKILTSYVSEIDKFLLEFDKQHPTLSLSQKIEIAKLQRVYRLRDDAKSTDSEKKLWDDFTE